jgi:soluble lytic murein transglycosylase-like protein
MSAVSIVSAQRIEMSRIKTAEAQKMDNVPSPKKEAVTEPQNKPEEKPVEKKQEPKPEPPKVDPNGCEAKGMWYRADNNECIPKNTPAPVASSQAAPVARVATSGVEQWRGLVSQYFGGETDYALRIMQCESGGNAAAHSPTNDYGLMQVNAVHAAKVGGNLNALYDPATNIRIAKQIRDGSGWGAWSCSRKI